MVLAPQIFSPRPRSSAMTASMPFLSIVRRPWPDTRSWIQRFSLGTQKRRSCRFGCHLRLVLLLAWETLLPERTFFPVTWQTLDIRTSLNLRTILGQDGGGPAATMRHAVLEGLGRTTRTDRVP